MTDFYIKQIARFQFAGLLAGPLFLLACSGGYSGSYGSNTIRTNPYNGQTDVSASIVVRAAFGRDMLASSITTSSFNLSGPAGNVTGSVLYDGKYYSAAFTPDKRLSLSSKYTATLNGSIIDSQGYSIQALTWTFTTGAGGWDVAQLLETDNAGAAMNPQIAADKNGNAIAVWQQSDGVRYNIWASHYTTASGWAAPVKLEYDDNADAINPKVAIDGAGNALVVWQQKETAAPFINIWAVKYVTGSGWGSAVKIEPNDAGDATVPDIAYSSNGNAIAVWQYHDGASNNIWANDFTAGVWGTAVVVDVQSGDALTPRVVMDSTGKAMAVWHQFDGTYYSIFYSQYTGTWSTALVLESNIYDGYDPRVAVDGSGNVMAVWYQFDGTRNNIWANHYTAGGSWGTATLIETDDTGSATNPTVAFDSSGNAIAVWVQSDGARNNVWSNRYTAGSNWGVAGLIETDNAGNAATPDIAMDSKGNAIAVWYQSDGVRDNIRANRYTAGSGWGTAAFVEDDNLGSAQYPKVAFDSNDIGIAVWHQSDGARENIWFNYYK